MATTTLSLVEGEPIAQVRKASWGTGNKAPKLKKVVRTVYVSNVARHGAAKSLKKSKGRQRGRGKHASALQAILTQVAQQRFRDFQVQSSDEAVVPVPQGEYFNVYIAGPSGSGKSTFIATWLRYCHTTWPDCQIYIFSPKDDDPAFEKIKPKPIYCKVDADIVSEPLSIDEFAGEKGAPSIIIFDDIEALDSGPISKAIETFQNQCLETGRKSHISTISVSHVLLNGFRTKKVINESRYITVFPGSNFSQIENYVKRYLGFTKEDILFLKQLPSRWVMLHRDYPRYMVYDTGVHLL